MPRASLAQFKQPDGSGNFADSPLPMLAGFILTFFHWVLGIAGIFSIVFLPIGLILYLSAGGDPDRLGQGKKTMLFSAGGFILSILGNLAINYGRHYFGA